MHRDFLGSDLEELGGLLLDALRILGRGPDLASGRRRPAPCSSAARRSRAPGSRRGRSPTSGSRPPRAPPRRRPALRVAWRECGEEDGSSSLRLSASVEREALAPSSHVVASASRPDSAAKVSAARTATPVETSTTLRTPGTAIAFAASNRAGLPPGNGTARDRGEEHPGNPHVQAVDGAPRHDRRPVDPRDPLAHEAKVLARP